jgi:hypothetical protein
MVSEAFKEATYRYRARGGKLYILAADHGMSPSQLSASITGARRVYDERLIAIGVELGLRPDEIFESEQQVAS